MVRRQGGRCTRRWRERGHVSTSLPPLPTPGGTVGVRSQCIPASPPHSPGPALSLFHRLLMAPYPSSHSGLFSLQPRSRALQVLGGHLEAVQGCDTVVLSGEPTPGGWRLAGVVHGGEQGWQGRLGCKSPFSHGVRNQRAALGSLPGDDLIFLPVKWGQYWQWQLFS